MVLIELITHLNLIKVKVIPKYQPNSKLVANIDLAIVTREASSCHHGEMMGNNFEENNKINIKHQLKQNDWK